MTAKIIRQAIIDALKRQYPSIPVYTELIRQGMKLPCFFVYIQQSAESGELYYRSKRDYFIQVKYFSNTDFDKDRLDDCNEISDKLLCILEWLELRDGSIMRTRDLQANDNEGILDFSASLTCYIEHKKEEEDMKKISLEVGAEFE